MIWLYAMVGGVFARIMIATILISSAPKFTVRFLELMKLLEKNEVSTDNQMYASGAGYAPQGLVFTYTDPAKQNEFATKKVAARIFIICIAAGLALGAIASLFLTLSPV